jgi:transcriptional regulator with XRE-family HTH domain
MDVRQLLTEARERAGLSQRLLARTAGTSKSRLASYESGAVSPTVQTLTRLLAACGLQARARLEPLTAALDGRVDALLATDADLDSSLAGDLTLLADSLSAAGVSWAVDGGVALRLHGLGAHANLPEVAFCFDEAGRRWLFKNGIRGTTRRGPLYESWFSLDLERAQEALAHETFGVMVGRLVARPVAALPPTVQLQVPWCDRALPVLTVDAVEQDHPQHAEVLARLRERRSLTG